LVTHFFPYPPNDGGRLGYFNPIKYLSRKNEVVLASMIDPGELEYISEMERYCLGVETYVRPLGAHRDFGALALKTFCENASRGTRSTLWNLSI
jgi:hypothetical protein